MDSTECSKILAYNLKYFRNLKGLTQEKIASAVGMGVRTYQELETGKGNPTLDTISLLAQYHKVMASRLLSLSYVKILDDEKTFIAKFKKVLADEPLGFLLRDFEGTILWGNNLISKIAKKDVTKERVNLFDIKDDTAKAILRAQINAEKDGLALSYLNSNVDEQGRLLQFRVYPTLVYPVAGAKPLFTATYLTPVELDCEVNYHRACTLLLSCL